MKITDQMMDEALVDIRQLLDSSRDDTGAYCLEHFIAMVALDRETKEYMTDLTSRDQRMMLSVLTIVHLADTKAELDADTDALLKVAADHMCQMAVLR